MAHSRKPIYDEEVEAAPAVQARAQAQATQPPELSPATQPDTASPAQAAPTSTSTSAQPPTLPPRLFSGPSPTQRPADCLADEVRRARLFLYRHSLAAEQSLDAFLSRALQHETRVAGAVAALAPSPASGEKLAPGLAYVGVSGMAGSILARNRGVLLRAAAPVALAGVAAAYCLPVTMANVGALVFECEKKVPGLAERHVAIRERVERFVSTGIAHSSMAGYMLEEKVGRGRQIVEEWLRKGN
ncbi:hypothetical protein KEM52_000567 [Ascosphaera acerosa]|nr:hypothetical protein KEM52_000567 [Ascosphaera acerosa]